MTRNLLHNLDTVEGFRDVFLGLVNRKRIKIDKKFKYILTMIN